MKRVRKNLGGGGNRRSEHSETDLLLGTDFRADGPMMKAAFRDEIPAAAAANSRPSGGSL